MSGVSGGNPITNPKTSVVDSNNSTSTPLGGGATFTGTGTNVAGFSTVCIQLFADVDSATDGMQFQFSTDDTNWDESNDYTMDVSDSNTRRFQFPVNSQYFRLVYTNGGGAQSAFRVQTILHRSSTVTSIHRVSNDLTVDRSAQLVRAVIAGETTGGGGGSMVNVKVNPSGTLEVNATQDTSSDLLTQVEGMVAHDDVDSDNPIKIGGKARTTNPTAVADADRVDASFDDVGRQVVMLGQPRDLTTHSHTAITVVTETTILAAGGAGVFHDLTSLVITNEDNVSINVTIKDSTAGTTRMIIAIAPKGGAVMNWPYPVTQSTANNNWTATLDTNPGNNVNFFVQALVNV